MPDTVSPARTFHQLHEAFRVDADRLRAAIGRFAERDRATGSGRPAALVRWFGEFRVQLLAHHRVEDEVWFPALAARSPEFVARDEAGMADDHRYLDALVGKVEVALERLADPSQPFGPSRSEAEVAATALADLLADHFAQEERTVVPLIDRVCTPEVLAELNRRADREHSLGELRFLLPWFVEHLPPAERSQVLRDAGRCMRLLYRLTRRRYRRLVRAARLTT